tara:strand:- start:252 stop:416 length:165 start_codon:yes stop_codon:yes gene_type:complete
LELVVLVSVMTRGQMVMIQFLVPLLQQAVAAAVSVIMVVVITMELRVALAVVVG